MCWDVIEHLRKPKKALLSLLKSVKPSGLLILDFPNIFSFKGITTKFTPYWFHKLVLNRIVGYKNTPFPTPFRFTIRPENVIRLSEKNGFTLVYKKMIESGVSKKISKRFKIA